MDGEDANCLQSPVFTQPEALGFEKLSFFLQKGFFLQSCFHNLYNIMTGGCESVHFFSELEKILPLQSLANQP